MPISESIKRVMQMNVVEIDVSKGKSMIAVMRPFGEVVASPFEISHTEGELKELTRFLKSLSGDTGVHRQVLSAYRSVSP